LYASESTILEWYVEKMILGLSPNKNSDILSLSVVTGKSKYNLDAEGEKKRYVGRVTLVK